MRDAPEMLWVNLSTGYVSVRPSKYSAEYIRADIHKAEVARLRETIKRIRFAVNSDSHAITFQTIGQYRTAILKVIAEETNGNNKIVDIDDE